MSLTISSSDTIVELGVVSMSMPMSANVSTIAAQKNNWFSAKHPTNDTLQVTFRQGSQDAQKQTALVLQRWQLGNIQLALRWPEEHMSYRVIVKTFQWTQSYDKAVTDLPVTFLLLTNMIQTSITDMIVNTDVISIVRNLLETDTIESLTYSSAQDQQDKENKELYEKYADENKQWAGCTVEWLDNQMVNIKILSNPWLLDGNAAKYKTYKVKFSEDLVKAIESGADMMTYLNYLTEKGQ